jgi:hypothetical protein
MFWKKKRKNGRCGRSAQSCNQRMNSHSASSMKIDAAQYNYFNRFAIDASKRSRLTEESRLKPIGRDRRGRFRNETCKQYQQARGMQINAMHTATFRRDLCL